MENPSYSRSISSDKKCANSPEIKLASRTCQSTKLRDILKCDKPVETDLSYADFHHEITKNPDVTLPKYLASQQSQVFDSKVSKEDELVRYMSNLPSYLEKGHNFQGKALNFGVLDWSQLEKWQFSQKRMPGQQIGCSPSSSTSSLFSTDGSSPHSSKGTLEETRKGAHVRNPNSTTTTQYKSTHVGPGEGGQGRVHKVLPQSLDNRETVSKSCSIAHQRMLPRVPQNHPKKGCQGGTSSEIEVFGEIPRKFQDSPVRQRVFGEVRCEKKDFDSKSVSGKEKRQTSNKYEVRASRKEKSKAQGTESSTIRSQETKLTFANKDSSSREKSTDVFMLSKYECSSSIDISSLTVNGRFSVDPCQKSILVKINPETDFPPKTDQKKKQLDPSESSFQHEIVVKNSSNHSNSCKNSAQGIRNDIGVEVSEKLIARRNSESLPTTRNPSPIRRLSSAMGKMIRNAGSRENSPVRRSSSKDCVTKSGSNEVISSIDPNYDNKLSNNSNNRGKSSPLRRLLDPICKPRASNSFEPSKKLSSSYDCKILPQAQAQALLQVSFKNGLPLLTFGIDNESEILGATMEKSSVPGKGNPSCIYTFFTMHEGKRKSAHWLTQGGKVNGQGYVPKVMAQMKVSDSPSSSSHNSDHHHHITREFNLFAVDGDEYENDVFHPTNELAAIVVKLSRNTAENDRKDGDGMALDSVKSQNFRSTVILPGGIHTVPSKGELSTLAERWRSGGSCDCGGWDLGCQLRVYTNRKEHERIIDSCGSSVNHDKFQLFSQGNQDTRSILSLSPFKERIYSVEFSSSLSLLQAFAICTSFIDCKRQPEFSEPSVSFANMTEACLFEFAMRLKTSNQDETPSNYFSNPPHSPVGRV